MRKSKVCSPSDIFFRFANLHVASSDECTAISQTPMYTSAGSPNDLSALSQQPYTIHCSGSQYNLEKSQASIKGFLRHSFDRRS